MSESDQGYNILEFLAKHDVDPKEYPEVYEPFSKCMTTFQEVARVTEGANDCSSISDYIGPATLGGIRR
jgi:hypothetical protein